MQDKSHHIRLRPDYGECHGPQEEQPDGCPAVPRGEDDTETEKESAVRLRDQLIKLGYEHPELRSHLRPILDSLHRGVIADSDDDDDDEEEDDESNEDVKKEILNAVSKGSFDGIDERELRRRLKDGFKILRQGDFGWEIEFKNGDQVAIELDD